MQLHPVVRQLLWLSRQHVCHVAQRDARRHVAGIRQELGACAVGLCVPETFRLARACCRVRRQKCASKADLPDAHAERLDGWRREMHASPRGCLELGGPSDSWRPIWQSDDISLTWVRRSWLKSTTLKRSSGYQRQHAVCHQSGDSRSRASSICLRLLPQKYWSQPLFCRVKILLAT